MAEGGSFFSQQVGEPQRRAFLELDRRLGEVQATIDALSPAHGDLTGLGDDDHTQYHNDARGDARYLQLSGGSLSGDLQLSLNAGNSNIEWTGATGPMGLEISPSGTFESALYYRTTPLAWSFENASGDDILTVDIDGQKVGVLNDSPSYTLDVDGTFHVTGQTTADGDVYFQNNALVASNAGAGNIDHIWHDETNNAWNFVSDSTYKAAGNSAIVAGSFSGDGSGLTSLNASNISSGTFPDRFSASERYNIQYIDGHGQNSRDKLRVWNNSAYSIGMSSGYTFGHLNDYAMSFQMSNNNTRGFWWGDTSHSNAQGAMSLTTYGRLTVARSLSVGQGESITGPSTETLYVHGNMSLRSGNMVRDSIYRVGGVYFTWDSDSYGTNTHHSIRSTHGDGWTDCITINSFGHVRINIDSNNNGSNNFEIGRHTTGTGNRILYIPDNGNGIYLESGWFRAPGNNGFYHQSHGGGWYMTDSTWVRVYNNKRIYSGSGQIRSDAGNAFNAPNMTSTWSYNTVRWNTNGDLMRYASLTEMKTDIVEINGVLGYLNERSFLYDLTPRIFHEAEDRVDHEGNPVYTTRGEYGHGFLAEEVLEVAPELAFFDHNGELTSYGNDALIPDIVAELQRLMPMIEELYGAAHPDWVPPTPRPADRAADERQRYDEAAAVQAAVGFDDISDPLNGQRHLDEEE